MEYFTSIKSLQWSEVVNAVNDSQRLLQALWEGDIILCGINYDRQSKTHTCSIEKITK